MEWGAWRLSKEREGEEETNNIDKEGGREGGREKKECWVGRGSKTEVED